MWQRVKTKHHKLQNRAARVISKESYETRLLQALSRKNVEGRHRKTKSILVFEALNNHIAPNLRASFTRMNESQNNYQLRKRETDLIIPKPKSKYLKKTFRYSGAVT